MQSRSRVDWASTALVGRLLFLVLPKEGKRIGSIDGRTWHRHWCFNPATCCALVRLKSHLGVVFNCGSKRSNSDFLANMVLSVGVGLLTGSCLDEVRKIFASWTMSRCREGSPSPKVERKARERPANLISNVRWKRFPLPNCRSTSNWNVFWWRRRAKMVASLRVNSLSRVTWFLGRVIPLFSIVAGVNMSLCEQDYFHTNLFEEWSIQICVFVSSSDKHRRKRRRASSHDYYCITFHIPCSLNSLSWWCYLILPSGSNFFGPECLCSFWGYWLHWDFRCFLDESS